MKKENQFSISDGNLFVLERIPRMIKLKTLKDLEIIDTSCPDNNKECLVFHQRHTGLVKLEELKAEAVKWIKIPKDDIGNRRFFEEIYLAPAFGWITNPTRLLGTDLGLARQIVEQWIKHFFNITEEKLK